jgi:hypothetical protein
MCGLGAESAFVECVSKDTDREDGYGKHVAAIVCIAASELGDGLVAVFRSSCDVTEGWVENDATSGNCDVRVSKEGEEDEAEEGEAFPYSISSAG